MGDGPPYRRPTETEHADAITAMNERLYQRSFKDVNHVEALEELHAQLVERARLYDGGSLQQQRQAVFETLYLVSGYLELQGFADAIQGPLLRPAHALIERENNSLDSMFAHRARPGRPKATLTEHERMGTLAALANHWLQTNLHEELKQSEKLAQAARKMRGRWFGTVTRAQLETARELVSQEAKDHPAVRQAKMVDQWLAVSAQRFGAENAFHILTQFLNDQRLPFGTGEGGILKTPRVSPTEES